MADEIDLATKHNEQFQELVFKNRVSPNIDIHGTGECIVCGDDVEPKLAGGVMVVGRFCDSECASEFDR